ncbi:UNKNOWN [Stylonychia lemnae]|uniref:Transcription initiation factor IIA subunit 2 n=1 Tax=Stylonychia lemnae TaxID=5949 RepID=A0A078B5X0_STYLE|nr:UNKNOWN [Stylonychia lemnae]|eukprot:CDW89626.1 UNKNOWN [Stylonychia lemnae]
MSQLTIYRDTTVGSALKDALKELENQIGEELISKVMESFDQIICQKFNELESHQKVELTGKCISYNNCDDVWLFLLDNCQIKQDGQINESSNHCRIVATDTQNREGQRREPVSRGRRNNPSNQRRNANRR